MNDSNPLKMRWANPVMQALLCSAVLLVFVPLRPTMPGASLDDGWVFGLNYAVAHGLAFGRELIFTFGPYASVYTKAFHPAVDALMLTASTYLALSYAFALLLACTGTRLIPKVILWIILAGVINSIDALLLSYPLLVSIAVWKLTCGGALGWISARYTIAALVVLAAPLGLLPLVKGSILIACFVTVGLAGTFLLALGLRRHAAATAGSFVLALLTFWVISGQQVNDLSAYLMSMLPIAGGYTEAMSLFGERNHVLAYGLTSACILAAVATALIPTKPRAFLTAAFGIFLFMAMKGSFVRHDQHALVASAAILLAGSLAGLLTGTRIAIGLLAVSVPVSFFVAGPYLDTSRQNVGATIISAYAGAYDGAVSRYREPQRLHKEYAAAVDVIRAKFPLPVLDGTTDVYAYGQSSLIASGNAWQPRPIFQSYSVYTPSLVKINTDHLQGARAPEHIIFRMETIDSRIPSLDDGASWPILLTKYSLAAATDNFLHLQQRHDADRPGYRTMASPHTFNLGEEVALPAGLEPVFVEIDLKPTPTGRLMGVVYKPEPLKISVKLVSGQVKTYRFVATMAKTGLLISPLIENIGEFKRLYGEPACLQDKRVQSFTISAGGTRGHWQSNYAVSFKALKTTAPPDGVMCP